MNFQESVAYLYSLGNEVTAMKLGLEATEKLLAALGNPERNFLKVQVAGTNGKGSTCVFLDAICRSANVKTGLFTSPHLISITERIKIEGAEISHAKFAEHATHIREISERLVKENQLETVPTFFEQMTAIGILAFAEAKIELAILETGLGGRFDSVTAARAEIAAITAIDLDHQNILGNSLQEIAAEKAAIIRLDTKVVVVPQKSEVELVIKGKCREVGSEPVWATTNIESKFYNESDYPIISTSFRTEKHNYPNVVLGLRGRHQTINAALAIGIVELLRELDFRITEHDVWLGLETARHEGRLEFFRGILFDGAHNISGAKALREYLDEFINQPITLVFGAMRDKDLQEIAEIIFPKVAFLVFTKPNNPRSIETAELKKFTPADFPSENVHLTETVEEALKIAALVSGKKNLVCVTGSLYLVGEAQKILKSEFDI